MQGYGQPTHAIRSRRWKSLDGWNVKQENGGGAVGKIVRGKMAESPEAPVTIQELLVSSLAQTDALAKLLIEKGVISQQKFMKKSSEERATYQRTLKPMPQ